MASSFFTSKMIRWSSLFEKTIAISLKPIAIYNILQQPLHAPPWKLKFLPEKYL